MRSAVIIVNLICLTVVLTSVRGVTTITEDTKGVILAKVAGDPAHFDKPLAFDVLTRDQVYVNIKTPDSLLIHIKSDRLVKYVFFLKTDSFPSKYMPEDLAVIKAKIDELRAFGGMAPGVQELVAPHLKLLQGVFNTESARYKQLVATTSKEAMTQEEQEAFDKKCELMRLDLLANKENIKRSEEIVKDMEPLAARSPSLTSVLEEWNEEKKHALQLAGEGETLWKAALADHPANFAHMKDVGALPDFPADLKTKAADLSARLDQFRNSVTYPQIITYCQAAVPAYYLLNQLPKMVEKVRNHKYEEASVIALKALTQVDERQIVDPYTQIYAAIKNYRELVDDLLSRYRQQLAKAKQAEEDSTDSELLVEYQKAYELIPDPKVGARIEQLKARIKAK